MKKIFSVVLVVLAVILLSAASYGFNRLDGTNVKSSKVLYKGEMILEGSFDYMPSIKPAAQQSDFSLDVLSIPFDFRMGLSKNREIGFEMRIDNQKTELGNESSNRTTLSKIGIASKTRVWKDLSFRLAAGYSMNGNSYYSADGIYASGMFLYDYTIEAGSILVNLGYEYAEGKFDFFEDGPELNIKNRFIYGIAYNYPAMKKLNLILEYSGAQKYASEFKNLGEISLGAKYKLDADIILTGALSSGVQDGSPDLTAKIGFQKLFGALNFTNEYLKHRWKESAEEPQKTKEPKQYPKKICPVCGYEAESDENYCPNDGTKLEFVKDIQDNKCGVCLNELPENANFCPYCGATVKKTVFK
ncbi:MAG TPA: zinc ribbon domain-containing protein, partial [bacterium]|nr:zinc ribbon domain-containing protein [bacterium]